MGSFLEKPNVEKHSQDGFDSEMGLKFAICAMQGWRVEMEDAHTTILAIPEIPGWSFFGVFDGHAGSLCAEHCAKLLLTAILTTSEFKKLLNEIMTRRLTPFIPTKEQMVDVEKGIKNGFLIMDRWLFELPEAKVLDDRSGCTAICSFVTPTQVILINLGDSRAVIYSGKPNASMVSMATMDHKPILNKERERIINAGGYVMIQRVNGSLAVSRAFGDFDYKTTPNKGPWEQMVSSEPDLYYYDRSVNDQFLIMACDGVWDVISNKEACDLVKSRLHIYKDLRLVTCNLVDTCFSKGSKDNMSAVIVFFKGAPKDTAEAKAREIALNTAIENKVAEMLKKPLVTEVSDIVQYLLTLLDRENLPNLPPGGGIFAKRDVVEQACRKMGFQTNY